MEEDTLTGPSTQHANPVNKGFVRDEITKAETKLNEKIEAIGKKLENQIIKLKESMAEEDKNLKSAIKDINDKREKITDLFEDYNINSILADIISNISYLNNFFIELSDTATTEKNKKIIHEAAKKSMKASVNLQELITSIMSVD